MQRSRRVASVTINSADAVDEEQVARPRPWNIGEIRRFILFIGPISSIFDYTTFFVMLHINRHSLVFCVSYCDHAGEPY